MAIQSPNYTQYPNEIIDTWMCKLTGAEFKILTAICRKTFGWSKNKDLISISQISELTGLGKTQIIKAVKSLEAHDLIVCERRDKQTTAYSIKVDDVQKVNKPCSESEQDRAETCSESEQTKEPSKDKQRNTRSEVFMKFWNTYDKKIDTKRCLAKWMKISEKLYPTIFNHVVEYVKSTPDKAYRKNPLTYLNGEHWNDEIVTKTAPGETPHKTMWPVMKKQG